MGFSSKQVQALRRSLDGRQIRTREANGRELSYIEGWFTISEANRIFGFDGWSRETIESRCVLARENRGTFLAVYVAKVRITVQADGAAVIREGHGSGEGRGASPGEVHDIALKAAETDATKRAFATFGKPFGLELYRQNRTSGNLSAVKAGGTMLSRRPASAFTPTIRHPFRGHRTTMAVVKIHPSTSSCPRSQYHQRRRSLRVRHPARSTKALLPYQNPNAAGINPTCALWLLSRALFAVATRAIRTTSGLRSRAH